LGDEVQNNEKEKTEKTEATYCTDESIFIYPSVRWRTVWDECVSSKAMSACFSPCNGYLAVLCWKGALYAWSILRSRREVRLRKAPADNVVGEKEGWGQVKERDGKRVVWRVPKAYPLRSSFLIRPAFSPSLISVASIPYSKQLIVHGVNFGELDRGRKCFFSPLGNELCVVMKVAISIFHISRVGTPR